jgi:6-phosphogluconolactonase (cycloisomerase 2 family)
MKNVLRRTAVGGVGLALVAVALPSASAAPRESEQPNRPGGNVYAATNAVTGNAIRTFHRAPDGTLTLVGDTPTGGTGSGTFEGSGNSVVLGGLAGESAPTNLTGEERLLFATNAGSDSVSVFRARGDELELVETEPTGDHPISVTVSRGIVYVLNASASNCMGPGAAPTITGYRLQAQGTLEPIPGSTRPVSGGMLSGCTQVTFNPAGDVLVVTEKTADIISTYPVGADGVAAGPVRNDSSGVGPFGFTFTKTGRLLTSENFGGAALQGAAASYDVNRDGTLAPVSGSVRNDRSDTCWIVLTDNQRFAYATNAMTNDISSYEVDPQGQLTLLQSVAAPADELPAPFVIPADLTLSRDSRFLYVRNVQDGDLRAFAIGSDGSLTLVQALPRALPNGAIGVASS